MRITRPHDINVKEKVFISVEPDDTTDAWARGDWAVWKLTDDASAAGGENTMGKRVERAAADRAAFVAGCIETSTATMIALGLASTVANRAATTRLGETFEVQVYGFHDFALVTTDGTDALTAGEILVMDGTAARATAAPGADVNYSRMIGFTFDALAISQSNIGLRVFVRCL